MSLLCSRSKKCSSVWRNTVQDPPSAFAASCAMQFSMSSQIRWNSASNKSSLFLKRAARYAGGLGDFVERCARNPFAVKGFQGGKHQVFFGFQGFGFGFSHNGVFVPSRFDGWDYKKDFVSVQSCMYNNAPEIETVSQCRSAEPTCFAARLNTGMPKQAVLYFETGISVKSKIL